MNAISSSDASAEPLFDQDASASLLTVRDYLRYAVSRFQQAELIYGHGTETALDEAAFLILHTLSLPIDQLEPWLDARLTLREREALLDVIEKRISTRKPAPYLVGEAYIQGYRFHVDERVIVPRSFLGELLAEGLEGVIDHAYRIERILDLCTGSGCLAIIAADQFPNASVVATDISDDALAVAKKNVESYGLADRVTLERADLFKGLGTDEVGNGERGVSDLFDLIVCNPPYVRSAAVSAFPAEYAAEPALAHDGGDDGLDLVHRILAEAKRYVSENGMIVVEIGQERDALEAAYPDASFLWLDTEASSGEVFALTADALAEIATVNA